jgi:F-type H+-transporting ATPase subunit a
MEHPFTWTEALGIPAPYQYLAVALVLMAVCVALAAVARGAIRGEAVLVPDERLTPRNLFEILTETMSGLAEAIIGHHSERYVPLFCCFFFFILLSNLIGLVPGFVPPTSNFNITFALGTVSFLAFNYYGFKAQGVSYLKHFMGPIWWLAVFMVPLELISTCVRPLSLGLRLFGNLFGDHLVLEIFTDLTKVGVPVVFYLLGTLVAVVQAFVFTLLSMIYVALAVSHGHEADLM